MKKLIPTILAVIVLTLYATGMVRYESDKLVIDLSKIEIITHEDKDNEEDDGIYIN